MNPAAPPPESLSRLVATVSFLKQVDLFREVPADYLVPVAQLAQERRCWAGEQLFAQGEPGDCLYLIGEGEVRILANGTEVARLSAGEVVGEMAVLDSHPRSATAIVERDGRLLRIGSDEFRLLLLSHPEMAMALLRTLARRLRAAPSDAPFLDAFEDARLGESHPEDAAASLADGSRLRSFAAALEELMPTLSAGTLLADRYRVDEVLGTTRYAAEDLRLGERVTVQLVPPAITRDPAALEHLRRRVASARRFSHANVQRAFDLVVDGESAFVTLEALSGPTLAARIADAGVIPWEEARGLAAQLASALAALEREGQPLPPLAPASIVLVPKSTSLESTRSWRLVLPALDFRGGSAPADVAGFGRLLVEMLTDRRDSTSIDGVDPAARPILERCFGLSGARRFAGFSALEEELVGVRPISPARRALVATALVLVVLGAGMAGGWLLRPSPAPSAGVAAPEPARRTVAVLGLAPAAGGAELAWVGTALTEMLSTEIGAGGRVRVVAPEQVFRARSELGVPPSGAASPELLAKLRARLGSDAWVSGSYLAAEGNVRLDLRLTEPESGRVVAEVSDSAPEGRLFDLASRLGTRLRYELRIGDLTARQAAEARAALPEDAEAARLYAEGLGRLHRLEAAEARALLSKAVAADPFHAPARVALARAHAALGYDLLAAEEARRAWDLSLDLPRSGQLAIEAYWRELARERGRAAELYRKMLEAAPDDPEPALSLAAVLVADGKAKEALAVVDALRKTPAGAGDPRVDLAEAEAAAALGDFARQLSAARRAAARGREAGALQIVARARLIEGNGQLLSKSIPEARAAYIEAKKLFEAAGDRAGAARTLTRLAATAADAKGSGGAIEQLREAIDLFRQIEDQRGVVDALVESSWALLQTGEVATARKMAQQARSIADDLGDPRLRVTSANAVANTMQATGDFAGALGIYREALVVAREAKDDGRQVTLLNNMAGILLMGNDPSALATYEEAIAIARRIGETRMLPLALMNTSIIRLQRGDLPGAIAANEESIAICRTSGNQRVLAYALTGLANAETMRGDTVAARTHMEEALELHRSLGAEMEVAMQRVYLAAVDEAEGKLADGLARAVEAAGWFRTHQNPLRECHARLLEARLLVDLRREREALGVVAQLRAIGSPFPEILRALRTEELRLRGRLGDPATKRRAIAQLESIAKEGRGVDYGLVFDALLAAAELTSDPVERRSRFEAVVSEATTLGFGAVVRRAERLRK